MKRRPPEDGRSKPWKDKPGADFYEKLAAAIEGRSVRDPKVATKIAASQGASSVLEVVAAPPAAAFEDAAPAPSSEAKSRAVEARRNAAAEPAEELPKRPKKRRHPTEPPETSPALEALLRKTRVAAPQYRPAQFSKADYAIARWTVGGSGPDHRAQQAAQTCPRILYHSIKAAALTDAVLEEIPERARPPATGERSNPKTARARKRHVRVVGRRQVREWSDRKARTLTAIAMVLYRMAGPTKRRGMNRCTQGLTLPMLATLVHQDNGDAYTVDYLAELTDDLVHAGVLYKEQPPADEADPTTVGPSGWATNVYYFTDRACSDGTPRELAQKPLPPGNDAPGTPSARRTTTRATADPPAPP